jgi:hypothetical protein
MHFNPHIHAVNIQTCMHAYSHTTTLNTGLLCEECQSSSQSVSVHAYMHTYFYKKVFWILFQFRSLTVEPWTPTKSQLSIPNSPKTQRARTQTHERRVFEQSTVCQIQEFQKRMEDVQDNHERIDPAFVSWIVPGQRHAWFSPCLRRHASLVAEKLRQVKGNWFSSNSGAPCPSCWSTNSTTIADPYPSCRAPLSVSILRPWTSQAIKLPTRKNKTKTHYFCCRAPLSVSILRPWTFPSHQTSHWCQETN